MYIPKAGALCPQCEKGRLGSFKKCLTFNYKGRVKQFNDEKVFKCDLCDYEGLTRDDNERVDRVLADFRRSVDSLFSCDELKSIRMELGLNKKEMAKVLSVNEKTIGRYENGKVTQSEHMDKLYRVLKDLPSAVEIIEPSITISSDKSHGSMMTVSESNYNPKLENVYHFSMADDYSFDSGVAVNASEC